MSMQFRETSERASRSEVAAHAVHPTARWRRCRADEEPWVGGGVRVEPGDGPREEFPQIGDAARDRAADVIRIVSLEIPSAHDVAREDAVAEAGCEPLDLPLDGLGLIHRRPVRYVTVRVAGVLAPPRRPGGVELALLDDEDEGPRRMLAAPDGRLRRRDLVEGPAEVDGRRLEAAWIPPGDRPVERPVDLEGAGAVAIAPEAAHVARGKGRFPDVGELRRTGVEQDDTRRRDVGEGTDVPVRLDPAAERPEIRRERLADRSRAAGRNGPFRDVRGEGEDHRDRRGERPLERQDRMRREPREQRARAIAAKTGTERSCRREEAGEPEPSQADRMLRDAERAEEVGEQVVRCAQERREEAFVGARVVAEPARRLAQ